MTDFTFETTPSIVCADGAAARLGALCRELGMTHAFAVTDQALLDSGLLDEALASLTNAGVRITTFSGVLADPPQKVIEAAARDARQHGVDGVIGIGGGSSMDTAKLVAILVRGAQTLDEMFGIGMVKGTRLPLIQVPTTAGTGSEVTPIAIVTTPDNEKKGVVSKQLYPDVALLDATLTLSLPPRVTAMTGIDAMVHAIEAYTSRHRKNVLSDSLAIRALQLLSNNLPIVLADEGNLDARRAMLQGSLMAGMAFANAPVAAVHALAYPLGGHFHVPHGLSNALVLMPVLAFNLEAAAPHYAELAPALLRDGRPVCTSFTADAFVQAMEHIVAHLPLERTLGAVGVREQDLELLATDAMKIERLLVNNPRTVTYEDALSIYRRVL